MGILRTYDITRSTSICGGEVDTEYNCLGCWEPTKLVRKFENEILHHYCKLCQNRSPEREENPLVVDMYDMLRDILKLRERRNVVREPKVLILEGNVGVGKTTAINKWKLECGLISPDIGFVTENINSWTNYPSEKMRPHIRRCPTATINLLEVNDSFVRQLYILRQMIEEFNERISEREYGTLVIERGIIGCINISKISPEITAREADLLDTYVKIFGYDDWKLCMMTDDVAEQHWDDRILIGEIKRMNENLITADKPDIYVDRKTDFADIYPFPVLK